MSRPTSLRIASTSRLLLVLFLLLPFSILLTPTLIAQGGGGELPFPPPEPPAIPMLSLAAAPVTINTFPSPTIPLTVTITNQGTGPATNLTLQMDSGLLTLPISQTLGILEAGQSLTTMLPLEFIGYEVGEHSLLLTTDAISLTNPVQATASLTLLEPISNPGNLTNPEQPEGIIGNDKGDDKGLPEFHLLQAQQPPTADYRGRVLTFSLTNSKGYDKDLTLTLSQWLAGLELSPSTLQLSYLPASLDTQNPELETQNSELDTPIPVSFTYDSGRATLTFTPQGDGEYALITSGSSMGESMGGGSPEEPQGWVPTFNPPNVSLFTASTSYQYPLLTPPGPGLFQPTLALGYSGSAGNGLSGTPQSDVVGFGWNLAGSIEVAQAVTICEWNSDSVCPVNAYWGEDNHVRPGLIELTLSIGGTGYELTHIDGPQDNGYSGRYTLKGNTTLYVEYCRDSADPSSLCLSADNGDGTNNGLADDTISRGYWVIKDSQNTLYRLGYTTISEQELRGGISNDPGYMGPWSVDILPNSAPAYALRWRVDQVKDRFSNSTLYTYTEYLPSQIPGHSWPDNVHAPISYLTQIDYGYNRIKFLYEAIDFGPPPAWNEPDVVSWQTHRLSRIEVYAQDYETGSGDLNLVRAYNLTHLGEKFGEDVAGNPMTPNQSSWCSDQDTHLWDSRMNLLTGITELDTNEQAKVRVEDTSHPGTYLNKPDVQFVYWWYKTGFWDENTDGLFTNRYCAPYLIELHTPYNPTNAVATFTYSEASDVYYNANGPAWTTAWLSRVTSQTLHNGWITDAPAQVTQFSYATPHYGGKASTDQWQEYTGAFQGFQDVTRILTIPDEAHPGERLPYTYDVNHFLAYAFNANGTTNNSALTGMMDWQELRNPDNKVMARTEENWTTRSVTIPGTSPEQMTNIPSRNYTIQYGTYYGVGSSHNVGNRTSYEYDDYGNPIRVREYGSNVGGTGTPYRVQQTEYVHNLSPANWLIGLPWQVTTWAGDVDTGTIISRQRTRYDNATCGQAGSQTPTNGLPTATDVYIPGGGSGHCDLNYLTTELKYGWYGDLWWQLSKTINPAGQWSILRWRNHTTLENSETLMGLTTFGFNDSHTPWLFTDKTAVNGGMSRYEYDNFGRLTKQYTPHPGTGQATVLSQQLVYSDTAPINNNVPLYIDTITVPNEGYSSTSRTFYDALGRARQQRSWNLASDLWGPGLVNKVVTDTEYNDLGQAICQTAPIYTSWEVFNTDLDCAGYDHTSTSYTRLGSPAISTGLDGFTSYGLALGRTSLGVDPIGRLSLSVQDAYGRLSAVTETEVTEDPFKTGTFNSFNWWLSSSYATATTLGGQSVLRVGKANPGDGTIAASVNPTLGAGSSFFFRFQLSSTHHDSLIMAKATDGSGAYVGLELKNGQIYPRYVSSAGSGTVTAIQIDQASGVWYRAHISINSQGQPSWRVWREDALGEPDKQFSYTLTTQSILDVLVTKTWRFTLTPGTTLGNGTAYLYLGAYQQGNYYVTRYTYDEANNLEMVTDAVGNETELTYDLLGRKLTMSDPDMGDWSYAYDLAGNLIRQTDEKDQRLCFYYDDLNRLEDKYHSGTGTSACPGTPSGTWLASYYYHWSGIGKGQLSSIYGLNNNVAFNESFTYDYRGRVTTTNRTIAGTAYSLSTSYDLLDRPLTLTYPGSEVVTTTYDKQVADTLQTSTLPPNQPLVSNVTYNHRLEMTSLVLGNTLTQDYTYYPASSNYRLQTALTKYTATGVGVFNRVYVYDAVGNIKQITTGLIGQAQEQQYFTYDSLGRLKTAWADSGPAQYYHNTDTTDYDYDAIGNLMNMAGTPMSYQDGTHKHAVTHRNGNLAFTYDPNGNMVSRIEGSTTYTQAFDVENRLKTVSMTGNSNVTNFAYDASGQRLRTTVAPTSPVLDDIRTTTTYPFPGYEVETQDKWQCIGPKGGSCTWQWTTQATITRKTYFLGGQAIATHISGDPSSSNNGFFYLHSDHLGSTSLLTYGNGQANPGTKVSGSETRYYPYGSQRLAPTAPADNITDRDFTGQKENLELGLVYYNARYYVPYLARFLTADVIVPDPTAPQSQNRYTYVLGNPIRLVDPSGHCGGSPDSNDPLSHNTTEQTECWEYLENHFCENLDCDDMGWSRWIVAGNDWNRQMLETLHAALINTIHAMETLGLDPYEVLSNRRFAINTSLENPGVYKTSYDLIEFNFVDFYGADQGGQYHTALHEIGHAVDDYLGWTASTRYLAESDATYAYWEDAYGEPDYSHPLFVNTGDGYYYRNYGKTGIGSGCRTCEPFADAFAAYTVHTANSVGSYSYNPDNWVRPGISPEWDNIYNAVTVSITQQ